MQEYRKDSILGAAPPFLAVLEQVSRLARMEKPALIVGERGTGKELFSARLHFLSRRWEGPFIKLNCATLPESLLESELFGHETGAFTGATRRHVGRFERADSGTLFLDEIAHLSNRLQEKLLRTVEYGEFERVGGEQTQHVDVRLIAATNIDLPNAVRENKFRADLLDRLAFDVVTIPPLRVRREDILMLADYFGQIAARELGWRLFPGFTQEAETLMLSHKWPGNVRELKNAIERTTYYHDSPQDPISRVLLDPFDSPYRLGDIDKAIPDKWDATIIPADLDLWLAQQERDVLELALSKNYFNQKRTATDLGLSYHQLRARLKKYELINFIKHP